MIKERYILLFVITIISINSSFGYVDPGTTGMIIGGSIWPFILGIFIAIGGFCIRYFKMIKTGVIKLFRRIKRKD